MAKKPVKAQEAEEQEDDVLDVITLDENLADVEKPPELPPGAYLGEVVDVQVNTSGKGNRYYAIQFKIPPDEIPPDIAEHYEDGAVMFWNRNVVPNAKDRRAKYNMRRLIEALGLDTNTGVIDPNEWMGCTAKLRVVSGKYQGESRAEIKSLEPAEAPASARGAATSRGRRAA